MFSFRSLASRWAAVQTAALLVLGLAFVAFQYGVLERGLDRDTGRLVEAHARSGVAAVEAQRATSLATAGQELASGASAEQALGLGLRVVGVDGAVAIARGVLSDRAIVIAPGSALDQDGPITFVRSAGGRETLSGFQARLDGGGWVQTAVDPAAGRGGQRAAVLSALGMGILAILIVLFIGRPIARRSLEPLEEIRAATERLSATRRMEGLRVSGGGGEVDRLGDTFNAMVDRLAVGVERMQRFSANVAHELRVPMSRIRNRIEARLQEPRVMGTAEQTMLEQTLADVDRLNSTVRAMLQLAHSEAALGAAQLETVCLRVVLDGVVDFFAPVAEDAEIELQLSTFEEALVAGDSNLLHELFGNLVDNAIKFTPAGRRVKVGLTVIDSQVIAFVEDEGPGIAEHERDRIFQAFLRLDPSPPGLGLGLALAREIAHAHRGVIDLESQLGKGSKFVVTLPGASSQA